MHVQHVRQNRVSTTTLEDLKLTVSEIPSSLDSFTNMKIPTIFGLASLLTSAHALRVSQPFSASADTNTTDLASLASLNFRDTADMPICTAQTSRVWDSRSGIPTADPVRIHLIAFWCYGTQCPPESHPYFVNYANFYSNDAADNERCDAANEDGSNMHFSKAQWSYNWKKWVLEVTAPYNSEGDDQVSCLMEAWAGKLAKVMCGWSGVREEGRGWHVGSYPIDGVKGYEGWPHDG